MNELSRRAVIIGALLTIVFSISNVYLGLKIGGTFSCSIPAAIIAMVLLRWLKSNSIVESNIVQTIASAAASQAAIVFILPAMVITGLWQQFPYWLLVVLCATSGTLGVLFTIPLRKVLVLDPKLPFPEGYAAASVLTTGHTIEHAKEKLGKSLQYIVTGTLFSMIWSLVSEGFQVMNDSVTTYFRLGPSISGVGISYSMTLIGAGYIIGFEMVLSLLLGLVLTWGVAIPILSAHTVLPGKTSAEICDYLWMHQINYMGAGLIGCSAFLLILKLFKPIWCELHEASLKIASSTKQKLSVIDDLPIRIVSMLVIVIMVFLVVLFGHVVTPIWKTEPVLSVISVILTVLLVVLLGAIVSGASGYMAGLVGSFNSPLSSLGILALVILALVLLGLYFIMAPLNQHESNKILIALVILGTSCVFSMACIAEDNLQDLKTGHIVGASPWKQQIALIIGVLIGSLVIPFVLNKMYMAYGFVGHMPLSNHHATQPLSIPQARMMSSLLTGIMEHHLNWQMICIGVAIGLVLHLINRRFQRIRISIMSVGIGIYLPFILVTTLVIGGVMQKVTRVKGQTRSSDRAVLLASGLIVGSAIMGVILSIIIVTTGQQNPLAYQGLFPKSWVWPSLLFFILMVGLLTSFWRKIEHGIV